MANGSRPAGRGKNIVSGGGNAHRRGGGGVTGGPVGGGFHGGSSGGGSNRDGGSRSGGGSILALLLGLLLGGAFNNNSGGNGGSGNGSGKKGCLGRIILLVLVVLAVLWLYRSCSGSGSLLSGYDGSSLSSGQGQSDTEDEADSQASSLEELLGETTEEESAAPASLATANIASDTSMYQAHEPDRSVDGAARDRYTSLKGDGSDKVTVMVYMCATDLESGSGMATRDLQEMLYAQLDNDNLNVIVCAGGTSKWQNTDLKAGKNYVFKVTSSGLDVLQTYKQTSMVDPGNLSAFIQYCAKSYPADRNMLVLWDHGGGSISGYGYDELYPNSTMTLDKLDAALKAGGVQFDVIGFDACLMATLETAMVMERYGDYLLASEAVEPGTGWYYTNWLTQLSQNPSADTLDIAKTIIDDFVTQSKKNAPTSPATLSLMDLAELSGTLPAAFTDFSTATGELLEGDDYATVSDARAGAKDFSTSSPINQIDLIDFALKMGTDQSNALAQVLSSSVKYNRASSTVANAYGVTIYFPYNKVSGVTTALDTYDKIGMDSSYSDCIKSFASLAAGGQITTSGSGSVIDVLLGGSGSASESLSGGLLGQILGSGSSSSSDLMGTLLSSFMGDSGVTTSSGLSYGDISSWFDSGRAMRAAEYYAENRLEQERLLATSKDGVNVLQLTEDEWSLIKDLAVNVYLDDGEGYIDLGLDNTFQFDGDGDLIMDFDGYWMSLDGQIVSFYITSVDVSGGSMTTIGRVPALLNGALVDIIVAFDDDHPDGVVSGAVPVYADQNLDTAAKLYLELQSGDQIDFLCDYYAYDGSYDSTYYLGEQMILSHGQGDMVVGYASVGQDASWRLTYQITDIYGNQYWTQALSN